MASRLVHIGSHHLERLRLRGLKVSLGFSWGRVGGGNLRGQLKFDILLDSVPGVSCIPGQSPEVEQPCSAPSSSKSGAPGPAETVLLSSRTCSAAPPLKSGTWTTRRRTSSIWRPV